MANEKNLKSLGDRTTSEQREIARKGGVASGEARRERKAMRECLEVALSMPYYTMEGEEQTNAEAIAAAMVRKAQEGDVAAARFIRDTIGEAPIHQVQVDDALRRDQAKFAELLDQLETNE